TATGAATGPALAAVTGTAGPTALAPVTTRATGMVDGEATGAADTEATGAVRGMARRLAGDLAPGRSVRSCTTRDMPVTAIPITGTVATRRHATTTRSRLR